MIYRGGNRKYLILAVGCVFASWLSLVSISQAQYLSEDAPDVVLSETILAKAAELGNDPVRIYEFVHDRIRFTYYYGLMKGPEGTLASGAGNDYDQAALLVSLFRAAGIPSRFVRGKAKIPADRLHGWLGTKEGHEDAALQFIRQNQGFWTPMGGGDASIGASWDASESTLDVLHIWVEALVPVARYRGSKGSEPGSGLAWLPLAPSLKRAEFRDRDEVVGSYPTLVGEIEELEFDYFGFRGYPPPDDPDCIEPPECESSAPRGYYEGVHAALPAEIFEDQLRTYIREQALPSNSPLDLADVDREGPVVAEAAGVLPNALPFDVDGSVPVVRSANLSSLHTGIGQPPLTGVDEAGAGGYRYRVSLHVCSDGTEGCDALPPTHSEKLLEAVSYSAHWETKSLVLQFPPTTATAPHLPNEGYDGGCTDTQGSPIHTTPTLFLEGAEVQLGNIKGIDLCNDVVIVVKSESPLGLANGGTKSEHTVGVGGTYVPALESWTSSAEGVRRAAQDLVTATEQYPLVEDETSGLYFIDNSPTDGAKSPGEKFLAVDFEAQRALVGGMLHLASMRWHQLIRDGERKLSSLHYLIPGIYSSAGLVSAGRKVSFADGQAFTTQPSNLLIDVKGGRVGWFAPDSNGSQGYAHLFSTYAHHGSAAEHAIWEEIAGLEAVSTVKGIQAGIEGLNERLLVVVVPNQGMFDPGNPGTAIGCVLSLGFCPVDLATYCTVKRSFPTSEFDFYDGEEIPGIASGDRGFLPSWSAACDPDPLPGTTTELRILEHSAFEYRGWQGFVYARYATLNDGQTVSMTISQSGSAGGGYATNYFTDPFSRVSPSLFGLPSYSIPIAQYEFSRDWQYNTPTLGSGISAGDPVSVLNGNYYDILTDFSIPGRGGFDLTFVRSYNSRLDYDGPLGFGWMHTFDQHIRIDREDEDDPHDDVVVWVTEEGTEVIWQDSPVGLIPQPANHDTLERESDGSFRLTMKSGEVYTFLPVDSSDHARLSAIEDRNGNTILCEYDSEGLLVKVIDTAGRELVFTNDENDRLSEVTDWTGRVFRYSVDSNGDLAEYMDAVETANEAASPGTGQPIRYTYYNGLANESLNHNLKCWIRAEGGRTASADVGDLCGPEAQGHAWMHFVYYSNDTVFKHTDALGQETHFRYNFFRKRTDVTQPDGGVETYLYDSYGNTTRIETAEGRVREYDFDDERREVLKSRDAFGFESTAEYDEDGNAISRTDRLGFEESFTYNDFGQVLKHTDKRGFVRETVYDSAGRPILERGDLNGGRPVFAEYRYDQYGNLIEAIQHVDSEGGAPPNVTKFEYDADGINLTKIIDPMGHATVLMPDSLGRVETAIATRTTRRGSRDVVEPITTHTDYDDLDRPISTTDPMGLVQTVRFDSDGLEMSRSTLVPSANGDPPTERIDVVNEYDVTLELIASTNALGEKTTIERDSRGRPIRVITPSGRSARVEYDLDGNVIKRIDPAGGITTTEYDSESRPKRTIDAAGLESRQEYDAGGRLLRSFGPGDRLVMEVLEYDESGNQVRIADAKGFETLNEFDEHGRLIESTFPVGQSEEGTTLFSYDLLGRMVERTDAEGRTTRLRYDALGRLVVETDGLGRSRSFEYDEIGDLTHSANALGETIRYKFDKRGQILERSGPGVSDRFSYDRLGRRVSASTSEVEQRFEYDDLDRLIAKSDNYTGTERSVYDEDGFVTQIVYPDRPVFGFPEGITTHYQYDARGQVAAVVDPEAGIWTFEYDPAGRLVRQRNADSTERAVEYDDRGFVAAVEISSAGSVFDRIDYAVRDDLGNPTSIQSSAFGQTTIAYDPMSRIQQIDYPSGFGTESFTYDRVGNRKTHQTRTGQGRTYIVDAADQLLEIRDSSSNDLLYGYTYDTAGRRATASSSTGPSSTYSFDGFGRLVREDRNDGFSMRLGYGPNGGRFRRIERGSPTAYYLGGLAEHRDGQSVRLVRAGPGGAVLAEVSGGVVRGLLRDGRANVSHVTAAGSVVAARRYEGFGNPLAETGSAPIERGFSGQVHEGESALIYMRARHYDPASGRFLQADPLGVDTDHLYAYAANNPYVYWDPSGLFKTSISRPTQSLALSYAEAGARAPSIGTNGSAAPRFSSQGAQPVTGTFAIPVVPGAPTTRAEFFIAAPVAFPGLAGDGRDFDPAPNPESSRALFSLDFEAGQGSFEIAPSCFGGGIGCRSALPIGSGNSFDAVVSGNAVTVTGSLTNSRLPGPSIDFGMTFRATRGHVGFGGYRNAYPSLEITQDGAFRYQGRETNPLRLRDSSGFEYFTRP